MKNKLKKLIYLTIYILQQKWVAFVNRVSINYNRFLLDKNGVIHKNATIVGKLYLKIAAGKDPAKVTIGEGFLMTSGNGLNLLCPESKATIEAAPKSIIQIGHHVKASSLRMRTLSSITIGNYVTIGANVLLLDTDCHSLDYRIRMGGGKNK